MTGYMFLMLLLNVVCLYVILVDSKMSSAAVGGLVGSTLSAVPVMIVSTGHFIHLSSATVPIVNIPQMSSAASDNTLTVQSLRDSCTSVSQNSVLSTGRPVVADLSRRSVSGFSGVSSVTKPVPRLSRLNAVDLSATSVQDSETSVLPTTYAITTSPPTISITFSASENELPESPEAERVIPRREIKPIPGAVCSAEDAARVGSSYLCSFCGKAFSTAPQLAVHRNIHFFERQFRCAICRSSFASRNALEFHRARERHGETAAEFATNSDPRPYKCDECGVAFRIQGHLAKHKRSKVHAARLETSQDVPGSGDAVEYAGALPLTVDERDTVDTEFDDCQHEIICCQEMDFPAVNDEEHSNSGEIRLLVIY